MVVFGEGPFIAGAFLLCPHIVTLWNEPVSLRSLGIFVPSHLCRFWYGRRVNAHGLFWEAWTHGLGRGKPRPRRAPSGAQGG